jgi:hypothetical protein
LSKAIINDLVNVVVDSAFIFFQVIISAFLFCSVIWIALFRNETLSSSPVEDSGHVTSIAVVI